MMNIKSFNDCSYVKIANSLGIFATTLLLSTAIAYLYSPVLATNASNLIDVEVDAIVLPNASLTVSNSDVNFSISPTVQGVFTSSPVTATVNTNSTGGYELYFSSVDEENSLVHTNQSIDSVIASDFDGTVTSSTMSPNKWGYSLDDTDFRRIPVASTQVALKNLDHLPSNEEKSTTVYFGAKIASDIPSGTYTKTVNFTAIAHESRDLPFDGVESMQDFTPEICSEALVGEQSFIRDNRGYANSRYAIKKLADGKCWMTENLRISGVTITGENSNIEEGTSFTLPQSSLEGFHAYDISYVYVDRTYGGYYTFFAATAGWGGTDKDSGSSPIDICPKGWRMATKDEYENLIVSYDGSVDALMNDAGYVRNGHAFDGQIRDANSLGYNWTSTVYSNLYPYHFHFGDNYVETELQYTGRDLGLGVRCFLNND